MSSSSTITYEALELAWYLADAVTGRCEKGIRDQIAALLLRSGDLSHDAAYEAKEAVLRHYREHGKPLVSHRAMKKLVSQLPPLQLDWLWFGNWLLSEPAIYRSLQKLASPIEAAVAVLNLEETKKWILKHYGHDQEFIDDIEPEDFAKFALEIL